MGFFKKLTKGIGGMIKRNVNFKTLVKTAGQVGSFAPGVGGVLGGLIQNAQAQHYAKKEEDAYNAQLAQEQAAYDAQIAAQNASVSIPRVANYPTQNAQLVRSNPTFMDILTGAGAGALTGAGGVLGGSTTAGQVGSTLMDNTLTTWLKQNWWKVVLGLSVIGGVIYFAVRKGNKSRKKW